MTLKTWEQICDRLKCTATKMFGKDLTNRESAGLLRKIAIDPLPFQHYRECMKLKQGQTWDCGDEFIRIVDLQRLEVGYKTFKNLDNSKGTHHRITKKVFCRMLKSASLVTSELDSGQE